MRNSSASQVETREISDSDLDNVSGGVTVTGGVAVDGLGLDGLTTEVTSAVAPVTNLVGGLTGALPGVTGLAGL